MMLHTGWELLSKEGIDPEGQFRREVHFHLLLFQASVVHSGFHFPAGLGCWLGLLDGAATLPGMGSFLAQGMPTAEQPDGRTKASSLVELLFRMG